LKKTEAPVVLYSAPLKIIIDYMRRVILPRHFIFSVLLLLGLISAYIFSEAQRLQQELLRQTEANGAALAEAMEISIRSSILGNSLLENLIAQRLLDNARLIDELLRYPPVDRQLLQEIAQRNRLQKIELLDLKGKPVELPSAPPMRRRMREMMGQMEAPPPDPSSDPHRAMMTFMWGRRWHLPQDRDEPPPKVADRKFWEGSVFGVAIGASSFPGIIAVHANADYIVNFRKEIDVQKQIDELGHQSGIEYVALLDNNHKILAHTDSRLVNQNDDTPFTVEVKAELETPGRVVEQSDGNRRYDIVKAVTVNGANLGLLKIGLSLKPMEAAWQRSLRSMIVFGLAVLAVGILGMATIFYMQQSHLEKIGSLEAEISRQERLSELGNLAATVAHEIRNPLNSVSMGLQRLKAEFTPTQDADDYARFLKLMQEEVHRLNSIVEQFLSLARPLHLNPEEIAIAPYLKELAALITAEANSSRVNVDLKVPGDLPPLHADRNYLKQLLLNLVLNGIQAMPEGGTLSIAARAVKDQIELTVADQGIGIKPAVMKKIFEPYFTTKNNGSGLGLSIARRIAEAHGGAITVESEASCGSRFRVLLPFEFAEA
jgi:signal transduction histidine kinase